MPLYQLRFLALDGSVRDTVELERQTDELAIEAVKRHVSGPEMELREGPRLVAHFDATAEFLNREAHSPPRDPEPSTAAEIVTLHKGRPGKGRESAEPA